jgi:hypothetical protein
VRFVVALAALLACGHSAVIETTPAAPPQIAWNPFPTMRGAGAATCAIGSPTALGSAADDPEIGFGRDGGLVVWPQSELQLSMQTVTHDGQPRGHVFAAPLVESSEVDHVEPLAGGGFVVVLHSSYGHSGRSFGLVVDRQARPVRPIGELPVPRAGFVMDLQSLGRDRVVMLVKQGTSSGEPVQWIELSVADGSVLRVSSPFVVPPLRVGGINDAFERAKLDGAPGWVVIRGDTGKRDGIFDGALVDGSRAIVERPLDAVVAARVYRTDQPPAPGPDGTIYELVPDYALFRTVDGQSVGDNLRLEHPPFDDMRVPHFVWSGSHFVFPYTRDHSAYLLAVDCAQ